MSRKREFAHDFSNNYMPTNSQIYVNFSSFSVGIFRWLPKASGKGLKKSAVMYRVKGDPSNPEPVYKRAEKVCRLFDNNPKWTGMKSETVR